MSTTSGKTRAGRILALLTLTLAALLIGPSAQAAGCSGYGCDGKDPVAMGCASDAYNLTSAAVQRQSDGAVLGYVEVRWSPSCKTNWTRIRATQSFGSASYVSTFLELNDGRQRIDDLYNVNYQPGTNHWGKMLYAPTQLARSSGCVTWFNAPTGRGCGTTVWAG